MYEATKGELSSLLFDSVRAPDVVKFAHKVSANWGVQMTRNGDASYTMFKPPATDSNGRSVFR
jgi:hypothetical protein